MSHLPVRVLHVVSGLGLGGTQKAMQLLVEHLDRRRFAPFVWSPVDGERRGQIRRSGVPVIVGGDLLALLEQLRPQVVHVHRAGWAEPALIEPVVRYRPRALVETNVFGRKDASSAQARIHRHLFVSRFCLERYAAVYGLDRPERYLVLPNPVDTDRFAADTPAQDFFRPVAGRLSRPDPGKWSELVFAMLPTLRELVPDFRFEVVGATERFLAFVAEGGFERNVVCLDQRETDAELARFFGGLSVLAHANDTGESFGMAIAEAMAAGLPVVTHPAAGLRDNAQLELVEHGRTGLVATTGEEYARALAWLWRNPDRARAMGQAGREKAAALWRAQTVAARLGAIYQELLES
ncbi:glycosyltransferase family 4 protein [Fundidesulfovibrio butyratiphilus]